MERQEWWVDAYAARGGDGSRARPWRAPPARVPEKTWLHLASGLYRGPIELASGARLTGLGTAVVFVEGAGVVVAARDARLEHISVQGGTVGLEVRGRVEAEDVHFSGHRGSAVRVGPGASGVFTGLVVEGSTGEDGLVIDEGVVELGPSRFVGSLKRAVKVERGRVRLTSVTSEGAATLVHGIESSLVLEGSSVAGGRGPGVFAAGGSLKVRGLSVVGQEFGVQATRAAVDLEAVTTRGSQLSGVALDRCKGRLTGLWVERAGALGGVQLLGSEVTLDEVHVSRSAALGVFVRLGVVSIHRLQVDTVRAEGTSGGEPLLGDGLQVRDAEVRLGTLTVRDVEGSGLYVSAAATVVADVVEVERPGAGAVLVERGARLRVGRLVSRGARGPALLVTDGGEARVGELVASGSEVPVWAECAEGARVELGTLEWVGEFPESRCVERVGP